MAAPTIDFSSLFSTTANTVSAIWKGESDAELARAKLKADATRDAALISAGYGYSTRPLSSSFDVSGLMSSVLPLLGLAIVGGIVVKVFKR